MKTHMWNLIMTEAVIRTERERWKEQTRLSEDKAKRWLATLGFENITQFNTGPQRKPDLKIDIGNGDIFYLEVAVSRPWKPYPRYQNRYPQTWFPRIEYRKTPYIVYQPLFFLQFRLDIKIGVLYTSEWVEVENAKLIKNRRQTKKGEWFYITKKFEDVNIDEEIRTGKIINRNKIILPKNNEMFNKWIYLYGTMLYSEPLAIWEQEGLNGDIDKYFNRKEKNKGKDVK